MVVFISPPIKKQASVYHSQSADGKKYEIYQQQHIRGNLNLYLVSKVGYHQSNIDLITYIHFAVCPNKQNPELSATCMVCFSYRASSSPSLHLLPVCSDGTPGIESNGACCVSYCGLCGGEGCSTVGESLKLGADDCCETEILEFGTLCSDTGGTAPCIIGKEGDIGTSVV